MSISSIVTKTVILTLQFPQLRLLWCKGPFETAHLFRELKTSEEEPNEQVAAQVGVDEEDEDGEGAFNTGPMQFLRSLPGINSKNIRRIIDSVSTVRELVDLPLDVIVRLLGPENGKALYEFFNANAASFDMTDG